MTRNAVGLPTKLAHPQLTVHWTLFFAVLACVVATSPLRATTLAIVRTQEQVIIAADSLLIWYGGDRRPQLACKVDAHADVIFAMAGLVRSPENDFDANRLTHTVLRTPGPLSERMRVLERLLRDRLHGTLTGIRRNLPGLLADQFESGFVLNITLATVRNRIASLEMRDFYAVTTPDGALQLRVARMSCPRDCAQPAEIFGVGETTAMMNYLDTLPGIPSKLPGLAEHLVRLEIADQPALVAPPIDVVRVGSNGIQWLQRKPACTGSP